MVNKDNVVGIFKGKFACLSDQSRYIGIRQNCLICKC